MRELRIIVIVIVAALGAPFAASAQQPATAQAPAAVRRVTAAEAVQLALEHNLGIRVARITPQVQDLAVAQILAAWNPSFTTTLADTSQATPNSGFLSGAVGDKNVDQRLASNVSVRKAMKWGGNYSVGWDNTRATTTNIFSNFSPQVNSSLSFSMVQPLLRNFKIDSTRQQLELGRANRDIAGVQLETSIVSTTRSVRHAYWDLAYATASLRVQQQSLDLARESLRNTRSRVEIGTQAPIDVVEAEAEVAQRDEAVIVAEAEIGRAEDALRALILDPTAPDFWTTPLEATDRPTFDPIPVDTNAAVSRALERRTDLRESRRSLQASDVSIRFYRNQTLPEVNAEVDYGLTALGGSQIVRGEGIPGPIIGRTTRSYGSVLGDLFGRDYPRWTVGVNVSYPLGTSAEESNLAQSRLQYSQSQTQLRNQELQVTTQVRDAARTLTTNQKRVASTRASRELAERRLDAEQKKFAAGQSTSFFVFQAQRDLAQAQNTELRAILDYAKSVVDFETVQEAPLNGGGAAPVAVGGLGGSPSNGVPPAGSATAATRQPQGF